MAWYSDTLILMPQYPSRFSDSGNESLFGISRQVILSYLDGDHSGPLEPETISFDASNLVEKIQGFEGFEDIAFHGEQVFMTVEARTLRGMAAYLVTGAVTPDLTRIFLDEAAPVEIHSPTNLQNMSYEALLPAGEHLVAIYEANGAGINPSPTAHVFSLDLDAAGEIPFPNLEYRITAASSVDAQGRFWVVNYNYPGDLPLQTESDPIADHFGEGSTHRASPAAERLVELQFTENGLALSGSSPIQLVLRSDGQGRNWEGLVRLEERGFLLVTDEHPETILGFVEYPGLD
jgi:hypothetical protein